jgi:GNAT superfamily N-acetyltransferase
MGLHLGWHTDLAVLRLAGSRIEQHTDHVVVRTPANPTYHWGNFVLVTDPDAVEDAERWVGEFERAFPDAAHRSIGLVAEPTDEQAWQALGLEVDKDDVLASDSCPQPTPVPDGYLVRQLATGEDWQRSSGLRVEEFADDQGYEIEFERRSTEARISMSERGHLAWFGAFHGDRLAAELGIVDCGEAVARYQSVVTATEHRRRGLAGHLLGVAAAWAATRGAEHWVIVADADTDASRLYQSRGFTPAARGARIYRKPPRSA